MAMPPLENLMDNQSERRAVLLIARIASDSDALVHGRARLMLENESRLNLGWPNDLDLGRDHRRIALLRMSHGVLAEAQGAKMPVAVLFSLPPLSNTDPIHNPQDFEAEESWPVIEAAFPARRIQGGRIGKPEPILGTLGWNIKIPFFSPGTLIWHGGGIHTIKRYWRLSDQMAAFDAANNDHIFYAILHNTRLLALLPLDAVP